MKNQHNVQQLGRCLHIFNTKCKQNKHYCLSHGSEVLYLLFKGIYNCQCTIISTRRIGENNNSTILDI